MKLGIYANPSRDLGLKTTRQLLAMLVATGYDIGLAPEVAEELGAESFEGTEDCRALFVLGGDGTILSAARQYVDSGVPLVGVNCGHLGFMSEIGLEDVPTFLEMLEDGELQEDERMMLEAVLPDGSQVLALNDFVVTRRHRTKMAHMDLFINGRLAEQYDGDGLVVSTSTGSTAYSLSAGGPIVAPNVRCVVLTPICPHSLYARSIVAGPEDEISVSSQMHTLMVSPDGQDGITLDRGQQIVVRASDVTTRFLRMDADSFFPTLKDRLEQWSAKPARKR